MNAALVLIPALTSAAIAVGVGALRDPDRSDHAAELAARLTGVGFAIAAVLAVVVSLDGPVSLATSGGLGLFADQLSAILLLLVLGVSAVVQVYARRYLRADVAGPRFVVAAGAVTTASIVMVTSASLVILVVAWVAVGLAVTAALGLYDLPAAQEGVRRTRRAFLIGDGALVLATAIVLVRWGDQDLRDLTAFGDELAGAGVWAAVVALLVVVAALARSAQAPLPSWLPATLAAPTPVSALLHAGVVNAGGFLLIRLAPVFGASPVATRAAFVAGAATAIWGALVMLTRPDVKGALAASTTSQMGFMIMTCGIGAYVAAVVHLVAHGMYKATLFLGSGGVVHAHLRHRAAPPAPADPPGSTAAVARTVAAAVIPAAALALSAAIVGLGDDEVILLLFAWATGAAMLHGWLRRRGTSAATLVSSGSVAVVASLAYVAVVHAVAGWVAPAIAPAPDTAVAPVAVVAVLAALLGLTVVRSAPAQSRLGALHQRLYVAGLTGSSLSAARRRLLTPSANRYQEVRP